MDIEKVGGAISVLVSPTTAAKAEIASWVTRVGVAPGKVRPIISALSTVGSKSN